MAGYPFGMFPDGITTWNFWQILACTDYSVGSLILSTYTLGYTIFMQIATYQQIGIHFHFYSICINDRLVRMNSFYDAFCWYNGAMYYTLYYSISCFFASLLIEFHLTKSIIAKIIITLVSAALAIFIAGGNFVTGLLCQPFSFMAIVWMGGEKKTPSCFSILIIYACAFCFQCICTRQYCLVRQSTVTSQPECGFS